MRPMISALFLALGPFLYFFGFSGLALIGVPHIYVPRGQQDAIALVSMIVGGWLALLLWHDEPDERKTLVMLTVVLLLGQGVLALVVSGGIIRW